MKQLTIFFLILFGTSTFADPLPTDLKNGKVTFQLPDNWVSQGLFIKQEAEILQLLIPDPATDNTADSANAGLSVEPYQTGVTVKSFGDFRLQPKDPSFKILTDFSSGDAWRTVLSTAHQGKTPYVIVDRFGVDKGLMVMLRVAFPIVQRENDKWTSEIVSDINKLIASLKIQGTNSINSELRYDKGVVWLRHFDDPIKTFRGN